MIEREERRRERRVYDERERGGREGVRGEEGGGEREREKRNGTIAEDDGRQRWMKRKRGLKKGNQATIAGQ